MPQLPANIEAVLFSVLNASEAWSIIKLNNVTPLSPKFIDKLLNSLQNNTHELVIKGAAFNNDAWIQFLSKKGSGLKVLGLELSEQDHDDDLQRLCEILVDHTKLKELDLGDTEITDYYYLDELLYRNYCIEKMILKEPSDGASRVIYDKINQRLSTEITGKNRFKLEQLTPEKALNFLINALKLRKQFKLEQGNQDYPVDETKDLQQIALMNRISFLLNKKEQLAITANEEKQWLEEASQLSDVYHRHVDYLSGRWPLLQVDLTSLMVDGRRTVGHFLLEKTLEIEDAYSMQCLLQAGANPLQPPKGGGKPFLVRVFEIEGPWQEMMIQHTKKNLSSLVPAVELLSAYPQLKNIYNNFKTHLEGYFTLLANRKKQPQLIRVLTGVMFNFQDRHEECAQAFYKLAACIEAATDSTAGKRVTFDSLFEAQDILDGILEDSAKANRGFLGRSKLHDDLLILGKELNTQLRHAQREIHHYEKEEAVRKIEEARAQDKIEMEAKMEEMVETRFKEFFRPQAPKEQRSSETKPQAEDRASARFSARR